MAAVAGRANARNGHSLSPFREKELAARAALVTRVGTFAAMPGDMKKSHLSKHMFAFFTLLASASAAGCSSEDLGVDPSANAITDNAPDAREPARGLAAAADSPFLKACESASTGPDERLFFEELKFLREKATCAELYADIINGSGINFPSALKIDPCVARYGYTPAEVCAAKSKPPIWLSRPPMKTLKLVSEFTHLTTFSADKALVTDLEDLRPLVNLDVFSFTNSAVSSIAPVAGFRSLVHLILSDTQVVDISPLKGLTKIKQASLSRNRIRDISPLEGLTNIEQISLTGNPVQSLRPLRALTKVSYLYIGGSVLDMTELAGLQYSGLSLSGGSLVHGEQLNTLANLRQLDLDDLGLKDLSFLKALASLEHLEELSLAGNPLGDLSPLTALPYVGLLDFSRTGLTDTTPLGVLAPMFLQDLALAGNTITSLEGLRPLKNLNSLFLPETGSQKRVARDQAHCPTDAGMPKVVRDYCSR